MCVFKMKLFWRVMIAKGGGGGIVRFGFQCVTIYKLIKDLYFIFGL